MGSMWLNGDVDLYCVYFDDCHIWLMHQGDPYHIFILCKFYSAFI